MKKDNILIKTQKNIIIKKSKTITAVTNKCINNLDEYLEPCKIYFENKTINNKNLEQFKNIIINTQENADLTDVCEMFDVDAYNILIKV